MKQITNPHDKIFPLAAAPSDDIVFSGLTKREYFSALAMQNLQSVLLKETSVEILTAWGQSMGGRRPSIQIIARLAVDQADALIKELNLAAAPSEDTTPDAYGGIPRSA